ncbi:acyltransferase family protein [Pseudochelatococcus sp. B33]
MQSDSLRDRLYSLDVLRGLASLSVVVWHWQHFFYVGADDPTLEIERLPFYQVLSAFYRQGGLGVDLFFALSGFVFFWLFSDKLTDRSLPVRHFAIDRFSRLYPLHIATMAAVGVLQLIYSSRSGTFFVYPFNDIYHALLNVLLVPAWGFERGWSFNAPIWSVSVEVALYALFVIGCLLGRVKYLFFAALLCVAFVTPESFPKLSIGIRQFFLGGLACLLLAWAMRRYGNTRVAWVAVCLMVLAWLCVALAGMNQILRDIIFPITIAAFAAISGIKAAFLRPLARLGDISYSTYLIHFPLQICFAMLLDHLGYGRDVFYNWQVFVLFTVTLLAISLATYHCFELPIKKWIRRRAASGSGLVRSNAPA